MPIKLMMLIYILLNLDYILTDRLEDVFNYVQWTSAASGRRFLKQYSINVHV